MKSKIIPPILMLLFSNFCIAQKAGEIIENGHHISSGKKLILKYDADNKVLKYDAREQSGAINLITLDDSMIFLLSDKAVNIYIRPVNPLSFQLNSEFKAVPDEVEESANASLGSIIGIVKSPFSAINNDKKGIDKGVKPQKNGKKGLATELAPCAQYVSITDAIENIQNKLRNDKKDDINKIFNKMKGVSYTNEKGTKLELKSIEDKITEVNTYFEKVSEEIENVKRDVVAYECPYPEPFATKYIFQTILKDITDQLDAQKKRLKKVSELKAMLDELYTIAAVGDGDGLKWCIYLNEVGRNNNFTITVKSGGYTISDKGEIVSAESKDIIKRVLRIRKFRKFVPEPSAGTVFTFFKYNTYGTTTDSSGKQRVASPIENPVKNINISAMLNWTMYAESSDLHPLLQVGAGINSGIPTLLFGAGLRVTSSATNRLRLTGGIAVTWLKELSTLHVGSLVTGTADIDKDLKYGAPVVKPYFGIQYNF